MNIDLILQRIDDLNDKVGGVESRIATQMVALDERLRTTERLVWIATGGVGVLGGLFVWGLNFLSLQLKL